MNPIYIVEPAGNLECDVLADSRRREWSSIRRESVQNRWHMVALFLLIWRCELGFFPADLLPQVFIQTRKEKIDRNSVDGRKFQGGPQIGQTSPLLQF